MVLAPFGRLKELGLVAHDAFALTLHASKIVTEYRHGGRGGFKKYTHLISNVGGPLGVGRDALYVERLEPVSMNDRVAGEKGEALWERHECHEIFGGVPPAANQHNAAIAQEIDGL